MGRNERLRCSLKIHWIEFFDDLYNLCNITYWLSTVNLMLCIFFSTLVHVKKAQPEKLFVFLIRKNSEIMFSLYMIKAIFYWSSPPAMASSYLPLTYAVLIHNNSQKPSSLSFVSFLNIYIKSLLDLNLQTLFVKVTYSLSELHRNPLMLCLSSAKRTPLYHGSCVLVLDS